MASISAAAPPCPMLPAPMQGQVGVPQPPCHTTMAPATGAMGGADAFMRLQPPAQHSGMAEIPAYRATIQPPNGPIAIGSPTALMMSLQSTATGLPPAALEIVHEKPVHMFIVSRDLSDFQHVHPTLAGPGRLQIPASFKKTGPYSVFTQFKPVGQKQQTMANSFQVPGAPMAAQPLMLDATTTKTRLEPDQSGKPQMYTYQIANLPQRVGRPVRFQLNVLKNGQPIGQIEPFLGAAGHAIMLNASHDNFIHAHAMDGINPAPQQPACHGGGTPVGPPSVLHFESEEPVTRPGTYKTWVQTKVDGVVRTIDWTFQIPG